MHVLMTETLTPRARDAAQSLRDAGHVVHHCHGEGDVDASCVGLRGQPCPLERQPIDVVVTVRPIGAPRPTPLEDGVLCGVRRKVPVVVAGAITADPWRRWETLVWPGSDLAVPVAHAAELPLDEHSSAATEALRASLALAGVDAEGARARVNRRLGSLRVVVESDAPLPRRVAQRAAVRICQAVRDVDPWARGIDVTVSSGERSSPDESAGAPRPAPTAAR